MKYIFAYATNKIVFFLLIIGSLSAMQDEQNAIELAKISLLHAGISTRTHELYRNLLITAADHHYHRLGDLVFNIMKKEAVDDRLYSSLLTTAFFVATSSNNISFIRRILNHISVKNKSKALALAVNKGYSEVVQLLKENGIAGIPVSATAADEYSVDIPVTHRTDLTVNCIIMLKQKIDNPQPSSWCER